MSPFPERELPPIFAARTALRLGGAFLFGVVIVVAFTCWDATRAARTEAFAAVTAVGDRNYFGVPDPPATPDKPIVQAEDQWWVPVSFEKEHRRDTQMLRVVRNESDTLNLYRPRKEPKKEELFVKIEPNGYIRLRPQ